ncbi:hypothetical protein NL378_28875, partial [Klebsiella pneumoniae]|nr:hypothetical protein [Klebsiella pneumoniae]
LSALSKKIIDMIKDHKEFMDITKQTTKAECAVGNNLKLPKKFADGKCYLVISHPPYLNSFNYSPVYSLEYYWGKPWETFYTNGQEDFH